jgi:hypothetical protein
MLFFQLMSRRYEHAATVLTSNKSFDEWGEIFGDEVMSTTLIDLLVHHCHIVNIRGNSYRLKNHTELYNARRGGRDQTAFTPGGGRVLRLAPCVCNFDHRKCAISIIVDRLLRAATAEHNASEHRRE